MSRLKKAEISELLDTMADLYPEAECALIHDNKYQLLVAVVLSAQTTDKSVNKISPALFEKYPNAAALGAAKLNELEKMLLTIGMYRTKSRNLIALAKILTAEYDGMVPANYEDLIKLPGVGRKTANVVLSVGFGVPRIAVDTHVFRLANRIGITEEKDVLKTETALMKAIPKERWIMIHHALIWHGRKVCMARNPRCGECRLEPLCRKNNLNGRVQGKRNENNNRKEAGNR